MPSQVLSGSSNPSYTNNTGQNVRLIINSLRNTTSITWENITYSPSIEDLPSDTYEVDSGLNDPGGQYGWFTRTGPSGSYSYGTEIRELEIRFEGKTILNTQSQTVISNITINRFILINGYKYYPGSYKGSSYGWSDDYCNSFDLKRAKEQPIIKEIALSNNRSFSASSGEYNIVVIKENGT